MNDKTIKVHLQFLNVFLPKFNKLNKYFQPEIAEIDKIFDIFDEMVKFHWSLADNIFSKKMQMESSLIHFKLYN
jgi:hypothetical protein